MRSFETVQEGGKPGHVMAKAIAGLRHADVKIGQRRDAHARTITHAGLTNGASALRLRTMRRVAAALCLALLATPACAGGGDSRLSGNTLGEEDDDSNGGDEVGTTSSSISASASMTLSSTDPGTSTADPTTDAPTTAMESTSTTDPPGDSSSSSSSVGSSSSSTGTGDGIDLSGWSIVQTESDRTFVIPEGTVLQPGDVLIVGRDIGEAAFEDYWGVVFGPDVTYFDSGDTFPAINGDETYELRDDSDSSIDGPTPALVLGESLDRIDPEDAGPTGWQTQSAEVGTPTPGTSTDPAGGFTGVFLSEVSDANGNGNFVYEFVELRAF